MTGKLENQSALITGAGRGIGKAIAELFAREGARVAIADIDYDTAQATAATIGGEAIGLAMDVAGKTSVHQGMDQVVKRFGQLDILVNNAGYLVLSLIHI